MFHQNVSDSQLATDQPTQRTHRSLWESAHATMVLRWQQTTRNQNEASVGKRRESNLAKSFRYSQLNSTYEINSDDRDIYSSILCTLERNGVCSKRGMKIKPWKTEIIIFNFCTYIFTKKSPSQKRTWTRSSSPPPEVCSDGMQLSEAVCAYYNQVLMLL